MTNAQKKYGYLYSEFAEARKLEDELKPYNVEDEKKLWKAWMDGGKVNIFTYDDRQFQRTARNFKSKNGRGKNQKSDWTSYYQEVFEDGTFGDKIIEQISPYDYYHSFLDGDKDD